MHTRGPWYIKENGGTGGLIGVASEASNWFIAEEVLPQDAALIAAAPELLAALEAFIADSYEQAHGSADYVVTTCEAREKAIAAIAKATGKEGV